jgi:hypothetical protein
MEMPPWEDKGWTTKPRETWLKSFLRRTLTFFLQVFKEGIIKKRVEGAVKLSFKEHHSLGLVMMLNQ